MSLLYPTRVPSLAKTAVVEKVPESSEVGKVIFNPEYYCNAQFWSPCGPHTAKHFLGTSWVSFDST